MKTVAAALTAIAISVSPAAAQSAFHGFHVGINAGPTMSDLELNTFGTKFDLATQGFVGGGSLGYMFSFSQGWLLDIEAMIDYAKSDATVGGVKIGQGLGYGGALSLGYMIANNNALYGKVGYEMRDFTAGGVDKSFGGVLFGAGTRWAINSNWSAKAEYLYTMYESTALAAGVGVKPSSNALRIGLDYRFY